MRFFLKILAAIGLLAGLFWITEKSHAQVIGLNPTPMAVYYWNTGTNAWSVCTNSSTANAYSSTPQAFALYGYNSGLGQWTPQTSCPGSGSGSGLTSFQGRTTPAAVLTLSDVSTTLQTATSCNVVGRVYSPASNACVVAGSAFTAAGDLSGSASSQTVIGIQGHAVVSTAPTDGQVLAWSTGLNEYVPTSGAAGITQLTGPVTAGPGAGSIATTITPTGVTAGTYVLGGGTAVTFNEAGQATAAGPQFLIASFTCGVCGTYETGYSAITSASGTASYTNPTVPTGASVSDGTNTTILSTPFTTWLSTHTYTTNTTFTLTALGSGQTQTATQSITFLPRSFGGTGTGGSATGATASGNTAVLVGATGTLVAPTSGSALTSNCTGQVYSVTTSGTQFVYLLVPCNVSNPNGGSFTTPGPTVFAMNTPTTISFTNQFGAVVAGYLYRSTSSYFDASNFVITVGN